MSKIVFKHPIYFLRQYLLTTERLYIVAVVAPLLKYSISARALRVTVDRQDKQNDNRVRERTKSYIGRCCAIRS